MFYKTRDNFELSITCDHLLTISSFDFVSLFLRGGGDNSFLVKVYRVTFYSPKFLNENYHYLLTYEANFNRRNNFEFYSFDIFRGNVFKYM